MRMMLTTIGLAAAATFAVGGFCRSDESVPADPPVAGLESRSASVAGLKPLGLLVGEWRGVGQPRRGSRVGAWIEKANCAWQFTEAKSVLVLESDSEKQFRKLDFGWDADRQSATAELHTDGAESVRYLQDAESSDDSVDVFNDAPNAADVRNRFTLRRISDIRMTLLFEQRSSATGSWRRLAEIGYTRAGERLASSGGGARQCVVTGGLGTMTVSHNGKTYYVCCEGCRQAFEADPEGTIAEYQERLKSGDNP